MSEDDLFKRHMAATGVTPIREDKPWVGRTRPPKTVVPVVTEAPESAEDDSALFEQAMRELGVVSRGDREDRPAVAPKPRTAPKPGPTPSRPAVVVPRVDPAEDELFRRAVAHLASVPDKDGPVVVPDAPASARRVRPSRSRPAPQDRLDLHGLNRTDALRELSGFVSRAVAEKLQVVLVVTGKGWHSEGGRSVLRDAVEEWLRGPGRSLVRDWSPAPRALGGRGALLLFL